jgi:multicomponent Na+:H+ antiporter subunit G
MPDIFSWVLIVLALLFMALGLVGVFRFRTFYARILITAKVETMGFLTMMLGILVQTGLITTAMRLVLFLLVVLVTIPWQHMPSLAPHTGVALADWGSQLPIR